MMDVRFDRYFNGVSDCSYCCVDPDFDESMVEKNLLLWGKAYPFDLDSLKNYRFPSSSWDRGARTCTKGRNASISTV